MDRFAAVSCNLHVGSPYSLPLGDPCLVLWHDNRFTVVPMNNQANNEWLVSLDDAYPHRTVRPLPPEYVADGDFAESPTGYAERVTAARLHVTACDGPVRPRKFKTFAAALEAARGEFPCGEASFDGVRVFSGITVRLAGFGKWVNVSASLR